MPAGSRTRTSPSAGGSNGRRALVPGAKGYVLRSPARGTDAIAGSVKGTAVQDNCDSADEEPGWAGTSTCKSDLELHTNGGHLGHADDPRAAPRSARPEVQEPGTPVRARHPERPTGRGGRPRRVGARPPGGGSRAQRPGRHPPPGPRHRLRPDPQLLALSAPLRRRRVPLRLRRHPDLERRSHHKAAVALLTVAAALSGCGGNGDARAQACTALDFRAATTAAEASRTLRAAHRRRRGGAPEPRRRRPARRPVPRREGEGRAGARLVRSRLARLTFHEPGRDDPPDGPAAGRGGANAS